MIKSLKQGIKLLKYTYKFKANIIIGMIFFAVGLTFLLEPASGPVHCCVYWMIVGMLVTGICSHINASAIVQSSPLKKTLQILVPVVLSLCFYTMVYLLFLLINALFWSVGGRKQDPGVLVFYGLMAIVFMLYNSGYKMFELVTVFFAVAFFSLLWVGEQPIRQMLAGLPPWIAGIIGLGEILLGALLQYCVALLTYRIPLSRRAIVRELRYWM